MEVGPLARLLVSYAAGHADVKETVGAVLGKLNVPVDALFSTLGRTAARGIDCALTMLWCIARIAMAPSSYRYLAI